MSKKKAKRTVKRPVARTVKRTVKRVKIIVPTEHWQALAKALVKHHKNAPKGKLLRKEPYVFEEDGTTQGLLSTFLSCPQKVVYNHEGYRDMRSKDSLEFGSLIHWLLELLAVCIRASHVKPTDGEAFFDYWIKIWLKKTISEGKVDAQKAEFLAAQAKAVFAPYCLFWAEDFVKTRWLDVEGTFDVQWNGVRLRGRRDGVCRYKGKRGLIYRLFETKTKAQIPEYIEDALLMDFQHQFYLTTLNEELDRFKIPTPVQEVMHNIVRRPGIKLKKNESLKDYTARVREDIDARPDHYYKRMRLRYSKADLARFGKDLVRKLRVFLGWLKDPEGYFERDETKCARPFMCEYLSACISGRTVEYTQDGMLFNELYD